GRVVVADREARRDLPRVSARDRIHRERRHTDRPSRFFGGLEGGRRGRDGRKRILFADFFDFAGLDRRRNERDLRGRGFGLLFFLWRGRGHEGIVREGKVIDAEPAGWRLLVARLLGGLAELEEDRAVIGRDARVVEEGVRLKNPDLQRDRRDDALSQDSRYAIDRRDVRRVREGDVYRLELLLDGDGPQLLGELRRKERRGFRRDAGQCLPGDRFAPVTSGEGVQNDVFV